MTTLVISQWIRLAVNKIPTRRPVLLLAGSAQRSAAVAAVASDELEGGEVAGNKITFEGEAKFRDNACEVGSLDKGKTCAKQRCVRVTVLEFLCFLPCR